MLILRWLVSAAAIALVAWLMPGIHAGQGTEGAITVCGPGTGLGVAQVFRTGALSYHVISTEGGHMDFAPLDGIEDAIVKRLRATYTRVSAERICAGPGIVPIYETLAQLEGKPVKSRNDKEIWSLALEGQDSLAVAALDRFCLSLGAVAGDLALGIIASSLVHVAMPHATFEVALPVGGNVGLFFGELMRSSFSSVGSFLVGLTLIALLLIARSAFSFIDWCARVAETVRRCREWLSGMLARARSVILPRPV